MKPRKITGKEIADIKKLLRYEDGKVFWKEDRKPRIKAGDRAGTRHSAGYRAISINQRKFFEHRVVWILCNDCDPELLDHINGHKKDNHIENLRELSTVDNGRAHRKPKKGATSKYRGVYYHKARKRFNAQINGESSRRIGLGSFTCEVKAAEAYDRAAIKFGYLPEALNFSK